MERDKEGPSHEDNVAHGAWQADLSDHSVARTVGQYLSCFEAAGLRVVRLGADFLAQAVLLAFFSDSGPISGF